MNEFGEWLFRQQLEQLNRALEQDMQYTAEDEKEDYEDA